jgi:hypothetical protein
MKKVIAAATNVGEVEVSAKSEFSLIDENMLKSRIYTIRGFKVMLDADLAEIYGYSTKAFNQQVKNNIEKFDEDFRFQLNDSEVVLLSRSKFLTSMQVKGVKGGRSYNPFAFTEQGIYMLMTVLKGERATAQSKALLLSPDNAAFLAGVCRGLLAVGVAQSAVGDADPFVCVQAQRLEDFLALVAFDFFLGAVNPDAAEPEAVSGVHEVPHGERTIVQVCRDFLFRKNEQNHGGSVERVEPFVPTANLAVHFGDAVAQSFVRDGDHGSGLLAHAACGVDARFGDLCDEFLAHGIGFEFADASAIE